MQAMRAGAQGVRIETSGRLSGAEMARKEKISDGRVPRNTIRAEYGLWFRRSADNVWPHRV